MQAYDYYKDIVTAVEPDVPVTVASNTDSDKEDSADTKDAGSADSESDVDVDISTTEEQTSVNDSTVDETQDANPENNPINVLNSVDASTDVKKERGVIALIDTGVSEHANVIDRISVIDDDASGDDNSHGDAMVNAIISQDPEAKILSIKAMDDNGYGTVSALVAAMEYAIEQKVSIINLSLYARTTLSTSVLKSEIEKATDAGIIVVGAAGNDGADVKDYVPGSVESAYIIGAAGKSGYRQVLSNYGETVDYNVVASSTSEAAALFTGFVSANGLDGVDKVLNQGLVFETGYGDGEDITIQDEDFSKYEVDESKSFLIRYTFADASKLKDDDTIDSLYLSDRYLDEVYAVLLVRPDVYDVGDGTYKVKLNSPMLNGAAVHGYMDVDFAHGNNGGHSVTDGISFDASTGIATIDASAFEHESDEDFADFSDLQAQVLIPVDDIRGQVIQNVTVVNSDGTEYTVRVPVHGLQNAVVPLALTGKDLDEELSVDDFDVYLNGNDVPETSFKWDDEKHTLVLDDCAMTTHSIKVVVKKEVDSLFRTAGPGDAWRGFTPAFRLKDGLSFSVGQRSQNNSLIMSSANHYEFTHGGVLHGEPAVIEPQMCRESRFSSTTSPARNTAIFSPRNVFGVNFTYLEPSDGSEMAGSLNYGGLWNVGIKSFCNHINTSLTIGPNEFVVPVDYTILDTWKASGMTYYAMSMLMVKGAVGTDQAGVVQAAGGVVVFCVEDDTGDEPVNIKLSVKKLWDDDEDALGLQPGRVTVQLKQAKKEKGGDYNGWHDYGDEVVLKPDSWSHTWSKVPRVKQVDGKTMIYKYKVVEVDVPEGYQVEYKQFSLSGVGDGDTRKATITNEIKPIKIHLRAKKVWDDSSNKLKVRPKSIKFALQVSKKKDGGSWSAWEDKDIVTVDADDDWTAVWRSQLRMRGKYIYKYKVVEKGIPSNYKCVYKQFGDSYDDGDAWDGTAWNEVIPEEHGTTLRAKVTNKIDPSYLKLHKDSELPDVTDDNDNYSLAGAIYEVYTDSDCASAHKANYIGGPLKTNSNGDTPAIKLVPGTYWVKETNAPDGFYKDTEAHKVTVKAEHTSDKPMKLKVTDKPKQGKIKITKTSKIPNKTDNNSAYSLENAQYGVYTEESCVAAAKVTTITTDAEGKGTSSNLPLGDYWVKEIADKPSKGFGADPTVYPVTITEKSDGTVTTPAVESKEPPVFGKIEVTKKSENPDMTDGNDCYSYEGAKYRIYTDEACTERYGTKDITIGANGKGELGDIPFGTYWVKELSDGTVDGKGKSYAKGYFVDTKTHKVVVKSVAGDSTNTTKLASEEPAMNDPLGIQIKKESTSPTTSVSPSLAGAEFTIRYYDTLENLSTLETKIKNGSVAPTRVWVIKTKKLGSSYIAMLGDGWKVSGDDFYKDAYGGVIVPLGTITVQETKPAPGYALNGKGYLMDKHGTKIKDNEMYFSQIVDENSGVNLEGGNEYTMKNSTTLMSCKIIKYDGDGNVLPGVTYKITDEAGNAVKDTDGNTIGEKTTGSDGTVKFEKLHPNVYYLTETKTVPGIQLLKERIRVEVPTRMSKAEAQKQNLDTSDTDKVIWSDEENCYLILECTFEVTNTSTFKIPLTGSTVGVWTFLPLGIGMVLLTGVAFVLFRKKKKNMRAE